ncbi:MAG: radical SAM/SPASM domain-containing protein [Thermodesulfobacteriota bacterium]
MKRRRVSRFGRQLEGALLKSLGIIAGLATGHGRYRKTVPHKIGSIKGAIIEAINIFYYSVRSDRSFGYTSLTVEPLNQCNIRCLQCPVNRGMKRPKEKMNMGLFSRILDHSPVLERVHLTGWGEPLLHKDIFRMIELAREKGLIATIVSNATLLDQEKSSELLDSKVSVVTFSLDGVGQVYEQVRGMPYDKIRANIINFLKLRENHAEKPFVEINVVIFEQTTGGGEKEVRREWETRVDLVTAQPLVSQKENRRKKRCMHLWRRMVVLSDGRVVPCCVDAEGELILGDAKLESVGKIFNGPAMRRLRRLHIRGQFPKLCSHCNEFYG